MSLKTDSVLIGVWQMIIIDWTKFSLGGSSKAGAKIGADQ